MATQATEVSTGVLKITPRPIDKNAKGALRRVRELARIQEGALRGESAAIDRTVDFIIANSEISGVDDLDQSALREVLLDELSTDDVKAIMKIIRGGDPVSPTNGD